MSEPESDGFISDFIRSLMTSHKELDDSTQERTERYLKNGRDIVREQNFKLRTQGVLKEDAFSGKIKNGYKPGYYCTSKHIGTVAAEMNSYDSYVFWLRQSELRSEGKPYIK